VTERCNSARGVLPCESPAAKFFCFMLPGRHVSSYHAYCQEHEVPSPTSWSEHVYEVPYEEFLVGRLMTE
jgi:hypothetical protein